VIVRITGEGDRLVVATLLRTEQDAGRA